MKRLGFFSCLVLCISLFFANGMQAHAIDGDLTRVTEADYNSLKQTATEIDQALVIQSSFNSLHAREYLSMLDKNYNALKAVSGTTKSSLEVQVLNEYISYLNTKTTSAGNSEKSDIAKILILVTQKFDNAVARVQFEGGTITSGERDSLINASNQKSLSNQVAASKKDESAGKCSLVLPSNIPACIDEGFAWFIKNTLLQVAGFLVWLSGNMLNYAVQTGILDFSKWAPSSLYALWLIVRQLVSLVVVFAGLYLGFMYIVGRADTFTKYIGWLVIFALFVNFSYPITRALVDVSNIVSLNIYTSAIGAEALTGNTSNSAGSLIMSRLGLNGLVGSATQISGGSAALSAINSTPGALLAVVFVFYAAYIFLMATAIIAVRTFVLVALTVASPLLLVDAVVPKLGDVAVKMRKIYFEQLICAPVFMIMLALTLKFMEIFQENGPIRSAAGTQAVLAGSGDGGVIATFFGVGMMLIMLHIMLKVTKAAAGGAGEVATNFMGKVGGFGLGAATGGAGLLARGSVGLAAARLRDSGMMDKLQGSRTGRGLYSLTNSLAQSTFDAKNIGMLNKGMASAGMGMGKGTAQTYDARFKEKSEAMTKKYASIKDGAARENYLAQKSGSVASRVQGYSLSPLGKLGVEAKDRRSDSQKIANKIREKDGELLKRYDGMKDSDKKDDFFETLPENLKADIRNRGKTNNTPDGVVQPPSQEVDENMNTSSGTTEDWSKYDRPATDRKQEQARAQSNQGDVDDSYVKMATGTGKTPLQQPPQNARTDDFAGRKRAAAQAARTSAGEKITA